MESLRQRPKRMGVHPRLGAYRSDVLLDELKRAPAMVAATMQASKIYNTSTQMYRFDVKSIRRKNSLVVSIHAYEFRLVYCEAPVHLASTIFRRPQVGKRPH